MNTEEQTGTKRTSSKVAPNRLDDQASEPEAKRIREIDSTSMNDVQHVEVHEFYSVPRIAPRTVGKYVRKREKV